MPILIGDGVKQSKEGKKMPGVKRLHQESENSGKPEYIFGHMFGAIGILIGSMEKLFCLPLSVTLQAGDKVMRKWEDRTQIGRKDTRRVASNRPRDGFIIVLGCILFKWPVRDATHTGSFN
jgi:hypothetical protein